MGQLPKFNTEKEDHREDQEARKRNESLLCMMRVIKQDRIESTTMHERSIRLTMILISSNRIPYFTRLAVPIGRRMSVALCHTMRLSTTLQ